MEEDCVVVKSTLHGCFGLNPWRQNASPTEYLERIKYTNLLFGDGIELIGVVVEGAAVGRAITRQPCIRGEFASEEEIESFLHEAGFEKSEYKGGPIWISSGRDDNQLIYLADLHSHNVIKVPSGELVPIDVILGTSTRRILL